MSEYKIRTAYCTHGEFETMRWTARISEFNSYLKTTYGSTESEALDAAAEWIAVENQETPCGNVYYADEYGRIAAKPDDRD